MPCSNIPPELLLMTKEIFIFLIVLELDFHCLFYTMLEIKMELVILKKFKIWMEFILQTHMIRIL